MFTKTAIARSVLNRLVLLAACLFSIPAAAAAAAPAHASGQVHPDAAPELAQFAFLIGHWSCDVDFIGADWETRHKSTADWTAYYIQGGRAIMDDFRGGFGENYLATTIRVFDRQEKGWRASWIDGQTGRWSGPFEGEATDEGMRFSTSMSVTSPDGKTQEVHLQFEFLEIEANQFRWRQNASVDGGKTWRQDTTRMFCKRSPEAQADTP